MYTDFDSHTDTEKKDTIFEIQNSASMLYGLLEQLLDWARTQTGNMPFRPKQVNLIALIAKIVDQVEPTVKKNPFVS